MTPFSVITKGDTFCVEIILQRFLHHATIAGIHLEITHMQKSLSARER